MPEADHSIPNIARASDAFRAALEVVEAVDSNIAAAIKSELTDQRSPLKLIASENPAEHLNEMVRSIPALASNRVHVPVQRAMS